MVTDSNGNLVQAKKVVSDPGVAFNAFGATHTYSGSMSMNTRIYGMFQFGKLAIQSSVSTLGTTAIAAQAMTAIMENVNGIAGCGVGIGMMTVVGQCLGAGYKDQAVYYIKKLTVWAEAVVLASCLSVYVMARPVVWLAGMEPDAAALCLKMILLITIVKPLFWAMSFIPAYGFRAAGDVKFYPVEFLGELLEHAFPDPAGKPLPFKQI